MPARATGSSIIRAMVLPALLGLVAGIAGGFSAFNTLQSESLDTTSIPTRRPVAAVTAPLPETDIAERLRRFDAPVFPAAVAKATAEKPVAFADAIGYATVLTSDGWLVTTKGVAAAPVVIALEGKLLAPKAVMNDPRTGLVFLKVETVPLQVGGFEETDALPPGSALYADDAGRRFAATRFSGVTETSDARSDEAFARSYRLDRMLGAGAAGGAVLTIGGNLAGIAQGGGDVFIPVHHFASILQDVFRLQPPRRAALGVKYLDLSAVIRNRPDDPPSGALVTAIPKGAAKSAGVLKGDVIVRLNGRELMKGLDLGETVMGLRPEDRVELEILREGERQTVEAVLQ